MSAHQEFVGCSQDVFHRNVRDVPHASFCTQENWREAVIALGQELELHGFLSPCANDETGQGNLDVISLVNTASELLCYHRNAMKTVTELECRMQRLHCDVDQMHVSASRQRDLLEAKTRQLFEANEKDRRANALLEEERTRLKNLREEIKKLSSLMVQRDTQYKHDLKRKDHEICKLKDKLLKVLTDKSGNNILPMGIEISSLVSKPGSKGRSRWKSSEKNDNDLIQRLCDDYERNLETVRQENIVLREIMSKNLASLAHICLHSQLDQSKIRQTLKLPLSYGCEKIEQISEEIVQSLHGQLKAGREDAQSITTTTSSKDLEDEITQALETEDPSVIGLITTLIDKYRVSVEQAQVNLKQGQLEYERRVQELDKDRHKLAKAHKMALSSLVPVDGAATLWQVDDAPSWTCGDSSYAIQTQDTVVSSSPVAVGPQYGHSRPPSRPGSQPHSRSQSITRESGSGMRSTNGVVMRESPHGRQPTVGSRPRSANLSPQRWTVVSPTGTLSRAPAHGIKAKVKSRTGSISPTMAKGATLHMIKPPGPFSASRKLSLTLPKSRGSNVLTSDSESERHGEGSRSKVYTNAELTEQLDRLSRYIEERDQSGDERNNQPSSMSDAEMEQHLEGIRKALQNPQSRGES